MCQVCNLIASIDNPREKNQQKVKAKEGDFVSGRVKQYAARRYGRSCGVEEKRVQRQKDVHAKSAFLFCLSKAYSRSSLSYILRAKWTHYKLDVIETIFVRLVYVIAKWTHYKIFLPLGFAFRESRWLEQHCSTCLNERVCLFDINIYEFRSHSIVWIFSQNMIG